MLVLPLFAPAAVPSSVALQPGALATRSMPEIFPLAVPVVALTPVTFSFQGRPCTATLTEMVAIVQLVKDADVIDPMPAPDRPWPLFSVPDRLIVQWATVPVVWSFTWPDPEKLKLPPGVTLKVAASAGAALRLTIAAVAAPTMRMPPTRLRIVIGCPFLLACPLTCCDQACLDMDPGSLFPGNETLCARAWPSAGQRADPHPGEDRPPRTSAHAMRLARGKGVAGPGWSG